jgi:hypothetical protein
MKRRVYITQGKLQQYRLGHHRNTITELHHMCKLFDPPSFISIFEKKIRIYEVHKIMPNVEVVSVCTHILTYLRS